MQCITITLKSEVYSMKNDSMINIRIDADLKKQAEDIFEQLGMSMSGAITIFLKQVVRDNAVPLSLNLQPLDEQIKFARSHRSSGKNAEELLADVRKIVGISD